MSKNGRRRWFRYDWKKGGDFWVTKAGPPPLWLVLAVSLALVLYVFLDWLSGWTLFRG